VVAAADPEIVGSDTKCGTTHSQMFQNSRIRYNSRRHAMDQESRAMLGRGRREDPLGMCLVLYKMIDSFPMAGSMPCTRQLILGRDGYWASIFLARWPSLMD
jgi:hypothetical protein